MRAATFIRFAQWRSFWRYRQLIERARFEFLSRYFRARSWIRDKRQNSGLLMHFGYVIAGQVFFALLTAAAIWLLELTFNHFGFFRHWPRAETSSYVSFLETVAQIGGVFIALYFTALISVAATVFAKVPTPIRNLLVGERIGSLYVRYLAFATFLPLVFVALALGGLPPFHLAVPFVALLAGMGVLLFVHLGHSAFNFFDPTSLAFGAFEQFRKSWIEATPRGFRWPDKAFQDHYRRTASSSLDAIAALFDICFRSEHLRGKPLLNLVTATVSLLGEYEASKGTIPSKSFWFEQAYRHPSWYLSPDYAVDVAQRTGTAVPPDIAFDSWWVEKRIEPLLLKYFRFSLRRAGSQEFSAGFLDLARRYLSVLVSQLQLQHAVDFLGHIGEELKAAVTRTDWKKGTRPTELDLVTWAEYYGILPTHLLLEFSSAVEHLTKAYMCDVLRRITWSSEQSVYSTDLPAFLIPRLEWLQRRIQFEGEVEGRAVTPLWYQQELVNQAIAEKLKDDFSVLCAMSRESGVLFNNLVPNDRQVWFVAGLTRARWEFLKKLRHHTGVIERAIEPLKVPAVLKDLPWPEIAIAELRRTVEQTTPELLLEMTTIVGLLIGKRRPESLPDYRGQFLQTLAEEMLSGLERNDVQLTAKVFPVLFAGSMAEFDSLRPEPTGDHTYLSQIQVALAPIFDLFEISGQALIYSELHSSPGLWSPVKSAWDKYLESGQDALKRMSLILVHGKPRFAIPPRGVVRTSWSRTLSNNLQRIPGASDGFLQFSKPKEVRHDSPLIRYLASQTHLLYELGTRVFVSLYLHKRPDAPRLEWPPEEDTRLATLFEVQPGADDEPED